MNIVKRLEVLKKETASVELKKSLHSILEMYNKGEISNEKILESVTNSTISKYKSDKAVQRFYLYENNIKGINNLGLKPLLFKFKNTAIYENDMLLQSNINRAIALLENNPEYKVVQEVAPILKNYTWNNAVRSMITTVSKAMNENKIYIAVAEAIENLETENGSELIIEKLSRAFALPEYDAKHYLKTSITESEKFMFPVLETLMKAIGKVEGLGLNRITKHTFLGRPIVEKATVVFESNNKTYRLVGKRLFESNGKGWRPVQTLTESFIKENESKLRLCEAIANFKQENGKLVHENFSIVLKPETIKVNGKLKAIHEGEQVQVEPDTYKVDKDENVVVLEKDGKKYEIAASKFESAKELGIIEESDVEIVNNDDEVINEFTGFEATPDVLSMAMDIKNNIGDISVGDDHVCICVDGKIIEIIKDESGKKCLYIGDESTGIDEMVDMDDEMKVQEAVEAMGVDIVQESDGISTDNKDTLTDEEREKLDETIGLKESELSQLNFNLERIENLDEGQKTDEITTFYDEMKGKRDALVEELNQLKLEKDGEVMTGDLESVVEQIYNNFETLRYDDSHKNEMDDSITVSGDTFKLTETVSVIPQIQYSKDDDGNTFMESVELLYPEKYLTEKAVEGIETSQPDNLVLMKGVDESQEFGDELKQKIEEAIKRTVAVEKKNKINEGKYSVVIKGADTGIIDDIRDTIDGFGFKNYIGTKTKSGDYVYSLMFTNKDKKAVKTIADTINDTNNVKIIEENLEDEDLIATGIRQHADNFSNPMPGSAGIGESVTTDSLISTLHAVYKKQTGKDAKSDLENYDEWMNGPDSQQVWDLLPKSAKSKMKNVDFSGNDEAVKKAFSVLNDEELDNFIYAIQKRFGVKVNESKIPVIKKGLSLTLPTGENAEIVMVGDYNKIKQYHSNISPELAKMIRKGEVAKSDDFCVTEDVNGEIEVWLTSDLEVMLDESNSVSDLEKYYDIAVKAEKSGRIKGLSKFDKSDGFTFTCDGENCRVYFEDSSDTIVLEQGQDNDDISYSGFQKLLNESKLNSSTNYFCTKHGDVMLVSYNSGTPDVRTATSTYSAMATKNFMAANGIDKDSIAWIMAKHAFATATNTPDFKGVKTVVYANQIPEFTIGTPELIEQQLNEANKKESEHLKLTKKLKKLETQLNEGKMQITEPVILLAINSKSVEDFKKQMQKYKAEKDSYTSDLVDALHRLGLPLNPDNDLKLLYDQVKKISKTTNESLNSVKHIGQDDWSRDLYKGNDGKTYVDVDGDLYTMTKSGEPISPVKALKDLKINESYKLVTKSSNDHIYKFTGTEDDVLDIVSGLTGIAVEDLNIKSHGGDIFTIFAKDKAAIGSYRDDKLNINSVYIKENSESDIKHQYMLLNRMQSDCEYFLNHGNGNAKRLYMGDVKKQIAEMKKIWNNLKEKPEWLSMEEINDYEKQMLSKLNESSNNDFQELLDETFEKSKTKRQKQFNNVSPITYEKIVAILMALFDKGKIENWEDMEQQINNNSEIGEILDKANESLNEMYFGKGYENDAADLLDKKLEKTGLVTFSKPGLITIKRKNNTKLAEIEIGGKNSKYGWLTIFNKKGENIGSNTVEKVEDAIDDLLLNLNEEKLIKGKDLNQNQKKQVLAAFTYRNTKENETVSKRVNPTAKITQTDAEWLDAHAFYFKNDGSELSSRKKHAEPHYMVESVSTKFNTAQEWWDSDYEQIIKDLNLSQSFKIITWKDLPKKIQNQIQDSFKNLNESFTKHLKDLGYKIKKDGKFYGIVTVNDETPVTEFKYKEIQDEISLPNGIIIGKDEKGNKVKIVIDDVNESFNDDAIIVDKPSDIKKYKEFEKLKDYLQSKFKDGVDFTINAEGGITLKSKTTTDKVVSKSMKLLENIEGGLADGKTLEDIAKIHNVDIEELQAQLDLGINVEMEHTDDESLAEEIAKDHLTEDPLYYTKLATIEKTNEDNGSPITFAKAYGVNLTQADYNELGKSVNREQFKEYFNIPDDADEDPKYKLHKDFNASKLKNINEDVYERGKSLLISDFKIGDEVTYRGVGGAVVYVNKGIIIVKRHVDGKEVKINQGQIQQYGIIKK